MATGSVVATLAVRNLIRAQHVPRYLCFWNSASSGPSLRTCLGRVVTDPEISCRRIIIFIDFNPLREKSRWFQLSKTSGVVATTDDDRTSVATLNSAVRPRCARILCAAPRHRGRGPGFKFSPHRICISARVNAKQSADLASH